MKKKVMPTNVNALGTMGSTDCIKGNLAGNCKQYCVKSDKGGNKGTSIRGTTPTSPATSTRNIPAA